MPSFTLYGDLVKIPSPVPTGAGSVLYDNFVAIADKFTNLDADLLEGESGSYYLDRDNHTGTQSATTIDLDGLSTPTYDDVQDWSDTTQSAGIISGCAITDGGSGTVDIAAGTGVIKSANTTVGANLFFDIAASSSVALTNDSINYIAVDYNSGTPQFVTSTTNQANGHTIFNLGKVYREDATIDIINSGLNIYDLARRIQQHHVEKQGIEFVSGAIVSETGTRSIAITAGVLYAGLNRQVTDAIDTNVADDFEYYYYTGAAWTESDETQIDNLQYNDIATGLETLANNKYGIHWVYKGTGSNTYVLYGQDSYTLANAQAAQPPSSLPTHVEEMGTLRAKIIIEKSDTTFTEIENVADVNFTASAASDHNELTGLQGGTADQYYHLTSTEYGYLDGVTSDIQTQLNTKEIILGSDADETITPGDGFIYWTVPESLDGWDLIDIDGFIYTSSTSGTPTFQIHNVTDGFDMLSTRITIDVSEYSSLTAATPPVINSSYKNVSSGDRIRIDRDVAGTGAKGTDIWMKFQKP